ncbi:MAG TPA: vWA domain-containing protein [Vicinamibacterales bacterium]|nr:vWA domain-containing protein [Vicinamibacterales bacterium]
MTLRTAAVLAVLAAGAVSARPADQRSSRERDVIVSASLSSGGPVLNLGPTDFIVREDRLAREVIRVAPAPPPSHVMILVDDSQASMASIPFLRSGITTLIKKMAAMQPSPQFGLTTFGERPTKRAEFSPGAGPALDAASKLFAIAGTGSYFLQAIGDTCKEFKKRNALNPIIVAFVAEAGPEFSSESHEQIADALRGAGAALWVVDLSIADQPDRTNEEHERAQVLGAVTLDSGGLTRTVISTQSIDPAFASMAAVLTSRYLVTYARPEQTIPPSTVVVTTKRSDVRLTSSRWPR